MPETAEPTSLSRKLRNAIRFKIRTKKFAARIFDAVLYGVVRPYHQTCTLARQKFLDRFNFCCACLLLCDHVIQTKNHHRIGVSKDLVVQWQTLTRLVNPLVHYDWMSRGLTDDVLKPHGRQVK